MNISYAFTLNPYFSLSYSFDEWNTYNLITGIKKIDFDADSDSLISFSKSVYKFKEEEWFSLIGKEEFLSLDKGYRDFLINTAGALNLGENIDIEKIYQSPVYEKK